MEPITTNPNRIDLDEAYMQMAEVWAQRSKANRKQVGALIVKDKQIISDGYNGMPAGDEDDTCEYWDDEVLPNEDHDHTRRQWVLKTKPEVLHAESNALAKIAENGGVGAQDATLYVTMSPCRECAKLIKQAKIRRVVFRELYRDNGGIEFLIKRGVEVSQLSAPAFQGTGQVELPPAPPVVRQTPKQTQVSDEVTRLRTLAAVAGQPAPKQVPQRVGPPTPAAPSQPAPVVDDVNAALAEAGLVLVNGVPVQRPAPAPSKAARDDDGPYTSSFL